MNDYLRVLLVLLAAVNPASVLLATATRTRPTGVVLGLGAAIGFGGYVLMASVAADALDSLDIQPETFRIAAGIVMLTAGAWATVRVGAPEVELEGTWRDGVTPLAIPLLVSPSGAVASASYAADRGVGVTILAAATTIAVTIALIALASERWRTPASAVARLVGALLTVLAVGLIVDGVRAI